MDQTCSKKLDLRDTLPPLVGLILIGILFIPVVKQLLGSWFVWVLGLLGILVAALIVQVMWRMRIVKESEAPTLMPTYIHSDEERAQFRAMMGVKERPPTPIKVVTLHVDDTASASDIPPTR